MGAHEQRRTRLLPGWPPWSESCRRTARSRPRHSLQCPRSNRSFAMSSRDTDFEFDFFEEPETQEASGRSDRSCGAHWRRPRASHAARPDSPARRLHAAAAAARPDRLRDPDRRPAPALGAELPGGQEARRLQRLHDEHEGGRRRLPAHRPRAQRRAHDPGDQARRAAEAAREPRAAAGARTDARASSIRPGRCTSRTIVRSSRSCSAPTASPASPRRSGARRGRRTPRRPGAARLAGRAARRERRRLGRPLQGAGDRRAEAENISGVVVPDSDFIQTPDLASTRSMVPIWERINGSAASGRPPARRAASTARTSSR